MRRKVWIIQKPVLAVIQTDSPNNIARERGEGVVHANNMILALEVSQTRLQMQSHLSEHWLQLSDALAGEEGLQGLSAASV